MRSLARRVRSNFPARQVMQYLVVGVVNTIFGYACYAGFLALYSRLLPPHYLPFLVDLASITTTPFGVTFSFLTYKFFVFHTEGHYWKEWLRCFAVYGSATLPGLFLLPIVAKALQSIGPLRSAAGYLAGAIVMGGTTVYTYLAHKNFSFARRRRKEEGSSPSTSSASAASHRLDR